MFLKKNGVLIEKLLLALFLTFIMTIIVVTVLASIFINNFRNIFHDSVHTRLVEVADLASKTIVNPDEFIRFNSMDDIDTDKFPQDEAVAENAAIYNEMLEAMREFANNHNLVYVYFMRDIGNGMEQIILDSDESEDQLTLDYTEQMDENTKESFRGVVTHMELGDYSASWEGIIAAYAPVYDSRGDIVAIVGVDIYDENIIFASEMTAIMAWLFIVCAVLLIISGMALFYLYWRKAKAYQNASIAKSEFLSRMSHEIRTPMNAIIGFTRLAQKSNSIEEIKPHLSRITDSSTFLLQLINSILDIQKIEAGKMQLSMGAVSITETVDNIYNMLRGQAVIKNISFSADVIGDIPKYIYCDNTYLTQILVNLLSNALKFTPDGGKVALSVKVLEKADDRARLEFAVTDSGIGIKKENIDKIFEAFEQGEGGIKRKFGGTGLGLNISRLLVGLFGGTLSLESEEGKGSKFWFDTWFDIVKKKDEPFESLRIPDSEKSVDLKGKTVLIFEDNEINQIIAGNALEELGATVEFAENGRVGYKKYVDEPYKYFMIFMDIQMPEVDGYEATRLIRNSTYKNSKTIPIIAMSANVFKEDVDASIAAGMNAHIGKPFNMTQVISAVYDVLKASGTIK